MTSLWLVGDQPERPALFEDLGSDKAAAGQSRARREGNEFDLLAYAFLRDCGGEIIHERRKIGSVTVGARIRGDNDREFWILSHGNADRAAGQSPGLQRTDTVRKAGCWAFILNNEIDKIPVLLITSHLPIDGSSADQQLFDLRSVILDVISIAGDPAGRQRLVRYLTSGQATCAGDAPWSMPVNGRQLSLADLTQMDGNGHA